MMPPVLEFQRVNLSHFGCSHSFVIPNYIGSRFLICFFLFSTHHKGCHRSEICYAASMAGLYLIVFQTKTFWLYTIDLVSAGAPMNFRRFVLFFHFLKSLTILQEASVKTGEYLEGLNYSLCSLGKVQSLHICAKLMQQLNHIAYFTVGYIQ